MNDDHAGWKHALAVTRPALLLTSPCFLGEIAERLREAGIQEAVARGDTAALYDWLARP